MASKMAAVGMEIIEMTIFSLLLHPEMYFLCCVYLLLFRQFLSELDDILTQYSPVWYVYMVHMET